MLSTGRRIDDDRERKHELDDSKYEDGNYVRRGLKKMFGRMFSGESIFQNRYTAQNGEGMIAFASSFPGSIHAIEISPGKSVIVQKKAYLAAQESVELSMYFQKNLGKGLFGGEGFVMQKLSGQGIKNISMRFIHAVHINAHHGIDRHSYVLYVYNRSSLFRS